MMMVITPKYVGAFNVNFNTPFKAILFRISW